MTNPTTPKSVRLIGTAVGSGSPDAYGVASHLAAKGGVRNTKAHTEYSVIIQNAVHNPGSWFNRKFYYDQPNITHSHLSSGASMFNRQGNASGKHRTDPTPTAIREALARHGGKFEAVYTRETVESDDDKKGKYMLILFVRWIPDEKKGKLELDTAAREESAKQAILTPRAPAIRNRTTQG